MNPTISTPAADAPRPKTAEFMERMSSVSDRFANSLNAPQNAQNRDAIIASLRPEQQNTLARRGITGNFNVTPSPTIPSNVLGSNITPGDVFQRRAQMEQQQNAQLEASRALTNAEGVAQAPSLDAISFVNSILAEAPTQTEQAQASGLDRVSSALGNLFGRGARTQELQNQAGLPQMQQELLKVNQQLAQAKAAFDTAIGNVPTEAGITAGGAEARVSALSNARAAQVGALASLSQAYQGNIELAQQFAKDTVDLEFMDREQAVANELQMIELRKDTLSREDKRRAERLQVALQRQEAELAAQKADRQSVMSAITEAAKNGAPQSLVQAASRLRDPMQAISMLSQYMADPLERQIKQAQLSKIYAEIAKTSGKEGAEGPSAYQTERTVRTLQSVDELRTQAKENPGIFGRTAAAPIPQSLRSNAFRNFRAQLDTLKANVAFGELQAMREASKTGGALGSVANQELQLLEATLGGLDMAQTPEAFISQLNKIESSLNRWSVAQGVVLGGGSTITAPDGTVVEIID